MFKEIFECSPVAMLLIDEKSQIQLANKHAQTLFDYTTSELIGKDLGILIPTETKNKHPLLVKEYFNTPLPRQMGSGRNLFGIKKDQSRFPIEVGLNPIQADGKVFVLSSVIDISERLKAEKRFETAVDAAPSGMLMINASGTIVLSNKKIEEIFGHERNVLLGRPIEDLIPDDFKTPHPTFVKSYINNPEPRPMGIGRELYGLHKSGRQIPVEIGLQPIFFDNEIFVISSIVDITQRREAEKEIQIKSVEIQEFSYRTSHDLRSPLLSIGGLADCILEDIQDGELEMARENTHKIKSLTQKLNQLVEDILLLTKADLKNEKKEVFDFQNYLIDAQERFSHILQESNVKIFNSFLHKKELLTQKTRLTQVLDNLLSNAIKYSKNDGKDQTVRMNTFNDQQFFYIQIDDNGRGIPQQYHPEVFGMFKRFHEGDAKGSGLGLYMVQKHIQKLGGKITFDSTPQGTTFYLEFLIG